MTRRQIAGPSKQEVLEIVRQNPTLNAHTIVQKFKCDLGRVNHARSELGIAQKRPFAPRNRSAKSAELAAYSKRRIDELEKQVEILKTNPNTEIKYVPTPEHLSAARRLEAELLDAKAVIAYLEKRTYGSSV
jgi:hypothetical protein